MKFIDLHNDAVTVLSTRRFEKYVRRARAAGVGAILVSVWTTEMSDPMAQVRRCRQIIDQVSARVGVELLLHIEDAWFVNERNVGELIACAPFSVGLTWNADNDLAGGAHGEGGLTDRGRAVTATLRAAGVVIDLAHLNRKSFYDVVSVTAGGDLGFAGENDTSGVGARGVFCSHACFDEVCPNLRNLDRGQVQAVVDAGGVVGLTLVGDFLCTCGRARFDDVWAHIKYFVDNFGEDSLCIGTDFHGTKNLPKGLNRYRGFGRLRKFLVKKGLSCNAVEKIFWKNAQRFFHSYNEI